MSNPVTYAFGDFIVNGLGADLIRIVELMYYCKQTNRNLHIMGKDDNWLLVPENAEYGRCWLYYFKPMIPIDWENSYPKIEEDDIKATKKMTYDEEDPFMHFSELLKSIYYPTDSMIEKKEAAKKKFYFLNKENYVAIHIRRGDKTSGPWAEAKALEIDTYFDALEKILPSAPSTLKYIYVATDSDEVIKEIKTKNIPGNLKIIYDEDELRHDGYVYKLYEHGMTSNEKEVEIITFMKNIDLLVESYELIGSRMSFFFIVAELLRGKKGISLSENLLYRVNFY